MHAAVGEMKMLTRAWSRFHAGNLPCLLQGFAGDEQLGEALTGCDLVIIPAGMPRKPGMSRDDLFKVNAGIVQVLLPIAPLFCPFPLL